MEKRMAALWAMLCLLFTSGCGAGVTGGRVYKQTLHSYRVGAFGEQHETTYNRRGAAWETLEERVDLRDAFKECLQTLAPYSAIDGSNPVLICQALVEGVQLQMAAQGGGGVSIYAGQPNYSPSYVTGSGDQARIGVVADTETEVLARVEGRLGEFGTDLENIKKALRIVVANMKQQGAWVKAIGDKTRVAPPPMPEASPAATPATTPATPSPAPPAK